MLRRSTASNARATIFKNPDFSAIASFEIKERQEPEKTSTRLYKAV